MMAAAQCLNCFFFRGRRRGFHQQLKDSARKDVSEMNMNMKEPIPDAPRR